MIQTRKDAATIRAIVHRLRNAPKPRLGDSVSGNVDLAEHAAQCQYIDWASNYLIGDLLALLPDDEKPAPVHFIGTSENVKPVTDTTGLSAEDWARYLKSVRRTGVS